MVYQTCHSQGLSVCPHITLNSVCFLLLYYSCLKSQTLKKMMWDFFQHLYVDLIPNVLLLLKRGVLLTSKSPMPILDVFFFFLLNLYSLVWLPQPELFFF